MDPISPPSFVPNSSDENSSKRGEIILGSRSSVKQVLVG
jgi:hypothetical protein